MQEVPLEKILKVTHGSMFKLVILVSRRAIELAEGAPKLCEAGGSLRPASIAFYEIAEGKISCKELDKKT